MNRSKYFSWSCLLFYLVTLFFLWMNCPHRADVFLNGDPSICYAPSIEFNFASDWHSALYLKECIFLKHILELCGCVVSGVDVLYVLWYIVALVIFIELCYFFHLIKDRYDLGCKFDILCSVFIAINVRGIICGLLIDFAYIACVFSLICVLFFIKSSTCKKWIRCVYIVVFVLLLYQMVELRKNAVLLLPLFLIGGIISVFPKLEKKYVLSSACLVSVLFYLFANFITEKLFSDQKTYPASVMMMSDMCVAASLRHELDDMRDNIVAKTGYQMYPVEYGRKKYQAFIPYFPSFPVNQYDKSNWDELKKIYINEWRIHFDTMLAAKALQIVQFYLHGYTPSCMVAAYDKKYNLEGGMRQSYRGLKFIQIITLAAWGGTMLITCVYTIILIMSHYIIKRERNRRFMLFASCMMFIYLMSFIIVTPTTDLRYKSVCLLVSCFVAAVACCDLHNYISLKLKCRGK